VCVCCGVVCGLVVNIVDALILAWGNAPHGHSHGPPPPPPVPAPGTLLSPPSPLRVLPLTHGDFYLSIYKYWQAKRWSRWCAPTPGTRTRTDTATATATRV
jgi:hypothetical protein